MNNMSMATTEQAGSAAGQPVYAGFWVRLFALMIDFMVMIFLLMFILVPLELGLLFGQILTWPISAAVLEIQTDLILFGGLKIQILGWLYFALMQSSSWEATIGKRALGLRVTTEDGKRLSFWRASGRYFAKYLSVAIWFLGFIIVGLTARKQGLHDFLAGTVVVYRKGE